MNVLQSVIDSLAPYEDIVGVVLLVDSVGLQVDLLEAAGVGGVETGDGRTDSVRAGQDAVDFRLETLIGQVGFKGGFKQLLLVHCGDGFYQLS